MAAAHLAAQLSLRQFLVNASFFRAFLIFAPLASEQVFWTNKHPHTSDRQPASPPRHEHRARAMHARVSMDGI